jgi:hypothetical protein
VETAFLNLQNSEVAVEDGASQGFRKTAIATFLPDNPASEIQDSDFWAFLRSLKLAPISSQ